MSQTRALRTHIRLATALALATCFTYAPVSFADTQTVASSANKIKPAYDKDYVLANFVKQLGFGTRPYIGGHELVLDLKTRLTSPGGRRSVLFVADPGAGKSATLEQVAKELAPEGYRIFELDMSALMAGAKDEAEIQARRSSLMAAFTDSPKDILAIDELNRLAGNSSFKDTLKIPLSNGDMAVAAALTKKELRESGLEGDKAFTSRFQIFDISNATYAELVAMLHGLKQSGAEKEFGVRSSGESIEAIARATLEYFPYEPPRRVAEDLYFGMLAAKSASLKYGTKEAARKETELQQKTLAKTQLEEDLQYTGEKLEMTVTPKVGNPYKNIVTNPAFTAIQIKISLLEIEIRELTAEIELLKSNDAVNGLPALLERYTTEAKDLAKLRNKKAEQNKSLSADELSKLARLHNFLIPNVARLIEDSQGRGLGESRTSKFDVGRIVSQKIGIPAEFVVENTAQKVDRIRDIFDARIVGHQKVKDMILRSIQLSSTEMKPIVGPAGLFLIDGASGHGKTEIVEALAIGLFGTLDRMINIEMAALQEHSTSVMLGSAPGLIGSEQGGIFEPLRDKPASLVNGDEFDKAARIIIELLHRPFDKGQMVDAMGRKIDWRRAFFVGTANYTGNYAIYKDRTTDNRAIEIDLALKPGSLESLPPGQERDDRVLQLCMMKRNVSASMLTRLRNRMIVDSLTPDMAEKIATIMADNLVTHVRERHGWEITLGEDVAKFIGIQYFDWYNGGRYLKDGVSNLIEQPLSDIMMDIQRATGRTPGLGTKVRIELLHLDAAAKDEWPTHKKLLYYVDSPYVPKEKDAAGKVLPTASVEVAIHNPGAPPMIMMSTEPGHESEVIRVTAPPRSSVLPENHAAISPPAAEAEEDPFENCEIAIAGRGN